MVIPNTQKSWIGKAHLIGQTLTASYIRPGPVGDGFIYDPPTYEHPDTSGYDESAWMLLDGTPASCTNIGLYYNRRKKPVDLVISGPNYGRNSTALKRHCGRRNGRRAIGRKSHIPLVCI